MKQFFIVKKMVPTCFLIFGILAFTSCKKDFQPPRGPVVLVAGYESNGEVNIAKYWINGQEVVLSDGTSNAVASSIFASGNNVYVAGTITDKKSISSRAVMWKNNFEMKLSAITTRSSAESIFVSGRDVYVAGNDSGAVYWKNGKEERLNAVSEQPFYTPGKHPSSAHSIFLSGNDIYVAGSDGFNAVYWKNGIETTVATGFPITPFVISIFVSGVDVYADVITIGGGLVYTGCYKNGLAIFNTVGWSTQVFAAGNDVYVAGEYLTDFKLRGAVYWENGIVVNLTPDPPPQLDNNFASANSIYVAGTNVYAAGFHYKGTANAAVYWENGVETALTDGARLAEATSIYVR